MIGKGQDWETSVNNPLSETGNMASLRCAAMMRSMRPRVSPAAMRSMGSYGPSTDSQPNSVDNKFSSDRLDKVRAFSLPK